MSSKEDQFAALRESQALFKSAIEKCMTGDAGELESLMEGFLAKNPHVSAQQMIVGFKAEGRTLMHMASSSGYPAVVELLLNKASDTKELVSLVDDKGFTPLINASVSESTSIMARLLELGADVNAQNKDGAAAIHFAAGDGSVERLELLILAGANPLLCSTKGGNALHWAAGKGQSEAIRYLLAHSNGGLDLDSTSSSGLPAVLMAAVSSSDASVKLLVEAGANIGLIVSGNLTVLHICAENNLAESVRAIIATETGQRCCLLETDDGNKPIHLAAMSKLRGVVEMLLPYSEVGSMDVDALLVDGVQRLRAWETKAAAAASAAKTSAETVFRYAPSTRELEATNPAANPEAEAAALCCKDKGNDAYLAKRIPEAIAHYTEAILLQGDNSVLWSNRSACYLSMGDPANALLDAEVCRRLKPDWTKGCLRLSKARLAMGMYEDAALAAFEGLKLDPKNKELEELTRECVKKGREEHEKKKK